jgi:Flp pilus assembly protein TadD
MVSRLAPNFAEGWNRRATINYLREDYGRALVDIERTLALEPRHWGAMSGLGIILRRMGRDDEALATFKEVLKLNPTSENARKAVDALSEQFAGEDA